MCIIRFDWLIALYLFISLVRNSSFLIVKTVVSGKKSVMSTNHCARTSCWWVRVCAPHLWFVHLPNWHFSLHLPPLQRPGICTVDNFQRLRFGSLPTSSQERVKQKSTFTFTCNNLNTTRCRICRRRNIRSWGMASLPLLCNSKTRTKRKNRWRNNNGPRHQCRQGKICF